jgi:hypothetical protein
VADLPDRAIQPEPAGFAFFHAHVPECEPHCVLDFYIETNTIQRAASQERPQSPFRTDSDLLDAYQDCIEREEAREAKPDLWDDIYGEDGTAAQERPSIDVDARRLFDLLWDERGALDAGIEGFSPNRYRSAARRILWRLSSPVPVEPGE